MKNKREKKQKTEEMGSASLQLGFPPWEISKLLKSSPYRGRQLGKQRAILLGREDWERRIKSRILFLLPSCSWGIRNKRTCILSDSPELTAAREITQTSHSCKMNHLSFISAHPVRQPGPSTISLSSSSAWRLRTHKHGVFHDLALPKKLYHLCHHNVMFLGADHQPSPSYSAPISTCSPVTSTESFSHSFFHWVVCSLLRTLAPRGKKRLFALCLTAVCMWCPPRAPGSYTTSYPKCQIQWERETWPGPLTSLWRTISSLFLTGNHCATSTCINSQALSCTIAFLSFRDLWLVKKMIKQATNTSTCLHLVTTTSFFTCCTYFKREKGWSQQGDWLFAPSFKSFQGNSCSSPFMQRFPGDVHAMETFCISLLRGMNSCRGTYRSPGVAAGVWTAS